MCESRAEMIDSFDLFFRSFRFFFQGSHRIIQFAEEIRRLPALAYVLVHARKAA